MPCFVTSCCEGVEAKLRGFSDAPLSRCVRNVTWQYVFRHWPLTLFEIHYKYKLFSSHKDTLTLFSIVSLLRIAEWSRVEWNGLEWSRGHWLRGSETLRKQWFRSLSARFLVKLMKFELFWEEASTALSRSFARPEKRYKTKAFWSKIWWNYEPRPEEQKTSSLLAFLKPLLREANEKRISFNRRMKTR